MNQGDIKLAIDMLEGQYLDEDCEDNLQLDHCINVLEDCGNEIAKLREKLRIAEEALFKMYSGNYSGPYYDLAQEASAKIREEK